MIVEWDSGCCLCGLRKAFDKVLNGRLIQKINMHGIHADLVLLIHNWLTDRKQRVMVEGHYSG